MIVPFKDLKDNTHSEEPEYLTQSEILLKE